MTFSISRRALAALLLALVMHVAAAQAAVLTSGNSLVVVGEDERLLEAWIVDDINVLFDATLFYRFPGDSRESSLLDLDSLGVPIVTDSTFQAELQAPNLFQASISIELVGGAEGSGESQLSTRTVLTNLSGAPLELTLFGYVDLDLVDVDDTASVSFTASEAVFRHVNAIGPAAIVDTFVRPAPDNYEIDVYSLLVDSLEDDELTVLAGVPAPDTELGPEDMTFATSWDIVIPADGAFTINIVQVANGIAPIPEPTTVALGGLMAVALGLEAARSRRNR